MLPHWTTTHQKYWVFLTVVFCNTLSPVFSLVHKYIGVAGMRWGVPNLFLSATEATLVPASQIALEQ